MTTRAPSARDDVFFVEPLWLSVLIPILFAPIPVVASLALRQRRAPAFEAACLAAAAFAIASVLGGALFALMVAGFVLLMHRVALSMAAPADAPSREPSSTPSRVRLTLAVIAQILTVAAMARGALADSP